MIGLSDRRGRSCVILPVLLLLFGLWGQADARSDETGQLSNYTAILTGDQVVPPVNTSAHGEVDFVIHHHIHSKDDSAAYTITLFQVNHLKEIDLRQAHAGQNGDKVVNGVLKQGILKRNDMSKGPMSRKDLNEFAQRSSDGDMYVLVTTVENPDGLLRGQVEPANMTFAPP